MSDSIENRVRLAVAAALDKKAFDVDVLEGDLAGGDGAASVFMDIINLPIARRTSHRGAWYHGTN